MRFLRKHAQTAVHAESLAAFVEDQKKRVIGLMVDGRIEPRDVTWLMASLHDGLEFTFEEDAGPTKHMDRQFSSLVTYRQALSK